MSKAPLLVPHSIRARAHRLADEDSVTETDILREAISLGLPMLEDVSSKARARARERMREEFAKASEEDEQRREIEALERELEEREAMAKRMIAEPLTLEKPAEKRAASVRKKRGTKPSTGLEPVTYGLRNHFPEFRKPYRFAA